LIYEISFVPLIEVSNLEKTYVAGAVKTPALRGISFSIEPGEFVAIMGPSGCGKSTLLHILGLLDRPTGGEYRFEGRSYGDYSEEELARLRNKAIGFIFQSFHLLPRTSALENVKLPLLYSDIDEKQWDVLAKKALEAVGLGHRLGQHPSELSGGEQQKIAIARALVNNPKMILADEPTGNLDSKSGQAVMEIIDRLSTEGRTVILVSHDINIARYAKRLIELKDGKIESDKMIR
jgi:putative ABC transport system ATP-binding protein